jgi:sugar/nucleoside kinase (ribokinase family)
MEGYPTESGVFRRPVDTTGAGDALAAGVLFGLLRGDDLDSCADYGFQMANLVAEKLGGRPGLPGSADDLMGHLAGGDETY